MTFTNIPDTIEIHFGLSEVVDKRIINLKTTFRIGNAKIQIKSKAERFTLFDGNEIDFEGITKINLN